MFRDNAVWAESDDEKDRLGGTKLGLSFGFSLDAGKARTVWVQISENRNARVSILDCMLSDWIGLMLAQASLSQRPEASYVFLGNWITAYRGDYPTQPLSISQVKDTYPKYSEDPRIGIGYKYIMNGGPCVAHRLNNFSRQTK